MDQAVDSSGRRRKRPRWLWPAIITLSVVVLVVASISTRAAELQLDADSLAIGSLLLANGTQEITVKGPLATDKLVPATADSYFHIGSNTKAMTATMIATLVEEGLLDWDTTVSEVWPEQSATFNEAMRDASLHELLTHRSGIQAFTAGSEWKSVPEREGGSRERRLSFAQWLLAQEPAGRRGLYLYSNAGYCVASAMAEERSGQSWEELMQQRLFDPLGMQVQLGWPLDHDAAEPTGYTIRGSKVFPYGRLQGYSMPPEIAPAGDLSMPLGEYAKFLQLHIDGLSGSPSLLSADSFAFLHEPSGHYACGWIVLERDVETPQGPLHERISTHDGSAGTFYIHTVLSHTRHCAAAAVVNCGDDGARKLTTRMVDEQLAKLNAEGTASAAQDADSR
ncbi:beta-lactamase family protein [bacterium]|nr:beta-lactamase family protein [bacterium]